jgi:hypothetical protein
MVSAGSGMTVPYDYGDGVERPNYAPPDDDRDDICPACGYRLGTYPGLCDTCHEWAD